MVLNYSEELVEEPTFYDTDCGNKKMLATAVAGSSIRYAILRSMTPRFAEAAGQDVPFGAYDIDTGTKKSLESHCRDNRRFYASAFQSKVPRFGRPWSSPVQDNMYDVNTICNSKPSTLAHSVETTSIKYAIHHSKQKRFSDKPLSEAPDITYEVDYGRKMQLTTAMKNSPIQYRNLTRGTSRNAGAPSSQSYHLNLGPGSYDFPYHGDATYPPLLDNRPLSSLVSRSVRFPDKRAGLGLGSTYRPENEAKTWHKNAKTISKAEVLRPQYLPKALLRKQKQEAAAAAMPPKARAKAGDV